MSVEVQIFNWWADLCKLTMAFVNGWPLVVEYNQHKACGLTLSMNSQCWHISNDMSEARQIVAFCWQ